MEILAALFFDPVMVAVWLGLHWPVTTVIAVVTLLVALACWVAYFFLRDSTRLAFALWFPLTAISAYCTLLWLILMPLSFLVGYHGTPNLFFGGFVGLTGFPVVLGISLKHFPDEDCCRWRVVLPTVLGWTVVPAAYCLVLYFFAR
jgi:hypothetical protein